MKTLVIEEFAPFHAAIPVKEIQSTDWVRINSSLVNYRKNTTLRFLWISVSGALKFLFCGKNHHFLFLQNNFRFQEFSSFG